MKFNQLKMYNSEKRIEYTKEKIRRMNRLIRIRYKLMQMTLEHLHAHTHTNCLSQYSFYLFIIEWVFVTHIPFLATGFLFVLLWMVLWYHRITQSWTQLKNWLRLNFFWLRLKKQIKINLKIKVEQGGSFQSMNWGYVEITFQLKIADYGSIAKRGKAIIDNASGTKRSYFYNHKRIIIYMARKERKKTLYTH